jgi:HSP20 family molecular chaperone IbpA
MPNIPVEVKSPLTNNMPGNLPIPYFFRSLWSEIGRAMDRFMQDFRYPTVAGFLPGFLPTPPVLATSLQGTIAPAVDISETEKSYRISVEVPGLKTEM